MEISITVTPNDPADVAKARAFVDRLAPVDEQEPDPVRQRVMAILKGCGEGRLSYVRLIAEASPDRAKFSDVVALFKSPKGVGGTHSSIERSWRAVGGDGMFVTTDRDGDARMDPATAAIVLDVLDEIELS